MRKSRNAIATLTFPDLPEELRMRHKQLSERIKYKGLERQLGLFPSHMQQRLVKKNDVIGLLASELKKRGVSFREMGRWTGTGGEEFGRLVKTRKDKKIVS